MVFFFFSASDCKEEEKGSSTGGRAAETEAPPEKVFHRKRRRASRTPSATALLYRHCLGDELHHCTADGAAPQDPRPERARVPKALPLGGGSHARDLHRKSTPLLSGAGPRDQAASVGDARLSLFTRGGADTPQRSDTLY